jgi:ABC-type branched-subunit amino acid transport system ATPase component
LGDDVIPRGATLEAEHVAATTTSSEILRVEALRCSFGGVFAVRDASFVVRSEGITGLIGPNGAGKSTVISLVSGATRPDSGSVRFAGEDITGLKAHQIARKGLVRTFQKSNLFARMTVLENLLVGVTSMKGDGYVDALLGKWRWRDAEATLVDKARELLIRFKMDRYEDTYAGELSGGEKRMVELMRAMMAQPKMLILDEPMAGVNPTRAREIGGHLRELADEGLAILVVEHEMVFIEQVCNRVIVMAQGSVLAEGTMAELRLNREVIDAYLS